MIFIFSLLLLTPSLVHTQSEARNPYSVYNALRTFKHPPQSIDSYSPFATPQHTETINERISNWWKNMRPVYKLGLASVGIGSVGAMIGLSGVSLEKAKKAESKADEAVKVSKYTSGKVKFMEKFNGTANADGGEGREIGGSVGGSGPGTLVVKSHTPIAVK
jgi:L-serine deaminase